jgi:fibronectin-binding autotransporter adhesin
MKHSTETLPLGVVNTPFSHRLAGIIVCLQLLLLGATGIKADVITQTVDQSGAGSTAHWNLAIWGTPAAVPATTNTYIIPSGVTMQARTPVIVSGSGGNLIFGGGWLTNMNTTTPGIRFLHGNVAVTANIVLNAGNITTAGQSGTTWGGLAGNLIIPATKTGTFQCFGSTPSGYSYWLMTNLVLQGSGTLAMNMAATTTTSGVINSCDASGFTGPWTVTKGRLEIRSGTTNALGSGTVTLTAAATTANPSWLLFNSANNLTISNIIAGAGYVVKQNSGSVVLNAANTFTGGLTNLGGLLVLLKPGSQTNTTIGGTGVVLVATNAAQPATSSLAITCTGSDTGGLQLSNTVTLRATNTIAVSQRNNPSVAIESISGVNVITNMIAIQTGTSGSFVGIQVDAGSLELRPGLTNAASGSTTIALQGNGTGLVSGPISEGAGAPVSLTKTGTGTWTLNANDAYTGATYITNGVLKLGASGALPNTSPIDLASGGTLDLSLVSGLTLGTQTLQGKGAVLGNLGTTANSVINVGYANLFGALNLSNNLTLGGGTINFDIGSALKDTLNVAGSLTLNGTTTIAINMPQGPVLPGTYRLINYTGTLHGSGSFAVVSHVRQTLALDTSHDGQVDLVVTGSGATSITWSGDGAGNVWDVITTHNWNAGTEMFYFGDNVTFDDSGSATPAVNVSVPVLTGSVTVNNTSKAYTFNNSGITGASFLTKRGDNTLTLANNGNSFSGVDIEGGTLAIGDGASTNGNLVTGSIADNAALVVNQLYSADASTVGGLTFSGPISGIGSVQVSGGGDILTLGGNNSYGGATTIDPNCAIYVRHNNALGDPATGTTVQTGGRLGFSGTTGNWTVAEPLTLNGTGFAGAPGALWMDTDNNNATLTGPVTLASPTQIRLTALNALTFANTVTAANQPLQCAVDATSGVVNFGNTLSLGSEAAFTKSGAGSAVLYGSSNLWASTVVSNGALRIVTTTPPQIGDVTVYSGSFKIGSATDNVSGSLPPGLINLVGSSTYMTINTSNRLTLANQITGAGYLSLFTNDVLTITASNSFSGAVYLGSSTMSSGIVDLQNDYGLGDGTSNKIVSIARSELLLHGNRAIPAALKFYIAGNSAQANPGSGLKSIHSVSDTNVIEGNLVVTTAYNSETSGGEICCDNGQLTINGGVSETTYASSLNLYLSGTNGNGIINGVISGTGTYPMNVVKSGNGTWTLNTNEAYTGATYITNGVLKLGESGVLTSTPVIHLEAGGTFDVTSVTNPFTLGTQTLRGKGAVLGDVTTSAGSIIEVGLAGQYGQLSLSNSLTLGGSDTISFDLGPSGGDTLNVGGSVTLNGSTAIAINLPEGTLPNGTYRLMNYNSGTTLQGAGSFVLAPPGSRQVFTLDTSIAGQVNLVVSGSSAPFSLTWWGGAGSTWDIMNTLNWNAGAEKFYNGDSVTFDDTGSSPTVSLNAPVKPGSMTVNNSVNDYTVTTGSSAISSPGSLTKRGDKMLTLNNDNSFSAVDIEGGTLSLGDGTGTAGSLSSAAITNNAALAVNMYYSFDASTRGGPTLNNTISGTGSVAVKGGGDVVKLAGANTYSGGTTIDPSCAIYIQNDTALGTTNGGTTVQAGGQLGFTAPAGNWTVAEPLTLNGYGFDTVGVPGALWMNTPNNVATLTGPVTLGSATRIQISDATTLTFSNTVTAADQPLWCSVSNSSAVMAFQNTLSLGNATFTKDGTGLVVLGGNSNLCSGTIVNSGMLRIAATNTPQIGDVTVNGTGVGALYIGNATDNLGGALPAGKITLVPSSANMTINSSNLLTLANEVSGAGSVTVLTNNVLTITASNSFTGTMTIGSGSLSAGVIDLHNSYGLGNSTKQVTIGRSQLQLTGGLDIPALITFNIVGDASLANPGNGLMPIDNVSGTNAIEGTVNVVAGTGTGEIGCDAGQLTLNGTVQNATATTRTLYLGGSAGVGIINGAVGNGTNGAVTNALSVIKRGNGTWVLNGPVTNTGNLIIQSGTLKLGAVASSIASTNIQLMSSPVFDVSALSAGLTVSNYATLKGNGTILGNISVAGTVSPATSTGTGIGALAVSGTLKLTGATAMEINRSASPNADQLSGGGITLGGTLTVNNVGAALQAGDSFNLFDGTLSQAFAVTNLPALSSTNLFWDVSLLNSQGIIQVGSRQAPRPTILPASVIGTNFILQVQSQSGFDYVVEATPALAPESWTGIQTNAGGGLLTFTIPVDPANPERFFRIRAQ